MRTNSGSPRWKRALGAVFYGSFLAVVVLVSTAAGWIRQSPLMREIVNQRIGISPRDPKDIFPGDSLTVLILGCDQDVLDTYSEAFRKKIAREFDETGVRPTLSRAIGRGKARTDMILVAKLDFVNNSITGVSIPRDVECHMPGFRPMKINAYYSVAKKGEEKEITKAAVEYLLPGVHIDRVVTLDYDAFQRMVDSVHGVPIDIDKDMHYVDVGGGLYINLKKGYQVLDGYNAMAFVRFRHNDSDFERQKRQKEFMVALKQQILSPSNLPALPQILESSKEVLGGALTDSEIAGLAGFAQKVPQSNIRLGMIPTIESKHSTMLQVDEKRLPQVLAESGLTSGYESQGSQPGQ